MLACPHCLFPTISFLLITMIASCFFVNYLHSLLQQTNLGTDTYIWKCRSHHYCKWRHFGRDCCHMDRFELQKVKNNNWSSLASYIHGLNYRPSSLKSNPNCNSSLSMPDVTFGQLFKETPIWNYLPIRAQVAQARYMSSSLYVDLCIVTWLERFAYL